MNADPIADMLTRIRNANALRYEEVSMPSSKAKKQTPTPKMLAHIVREMIKSDDLRGCSLITSSLGGIEANAKAAKVSMMRFTQSICVTVRGNSVPMKAPISTANSATKLMVSWNRMKRWIFL